MITYNHEPWIAQAIDSVLMQETEFEYELIIGEDDSSDNTRDIAKTYKERYPERIQLFLNDRSKVIYFDGKPTGNWNFYNNLKHAKGEYVALLDGDDYWTSPHKLQKQVDFLDARPDFAICFHNAERIFVDGSRPPKRYCPPNQKEVSTLEDLLLSDFIPTCSVLFRRGLIEELPDWLYRFPVADWPLLVLNAQHGSIGYLNESMAVYRVHSAGAWSGKSPQDALTTTLKIRRYFNSHLGYSYESVLRRAALSGVRHTILKMPAEAMRPGLVDELVGEVEEELRTWPSELEEPEAVDSQGLAELYASLVFGGYKTGRWNVVRECLPKAIRYKPALLRNRGIWAIAVEAFFGQRFADYVRRHPRNRLQA